MPRVKAPKPPRKRRAAPSGWYFSCPMLCLWGEMLAGYRWRRDLCRGMGGGDGRTEGRETGRHGQGWRVRLRNTPTPRSPSSQNPVMGMIPWTTMMMIRSDQRSERTRSPQQQRTLLLAVAWRRPTWPILEQAGLATVGHQRRKVHMDCVDRGSLMPQGTHGEGRRRLVDVTRCTRGWWGVEVVSPRASCPLPCAQHTLTRHTPCAEPELPNSILFVTGLPADASEAMLASVFGQVSSFVLRVACIHPCPTPRPCVLWW